MMEKGLPTIMMVVRGLVSKLPVEELEKRYKERMEDFRKLPGLVQKYYSRDPATGEWAGIYLWDSKKSMESFLQSDLRKTIPTAYELTQPPVVDVFPLVDVHRT